MDSSPGTNTEIRKWYLEQLSLIPGFNRQWIAQGHAPEKRARAAWLFRHEARLTARGMMSDPVEVDRLRARDFKKYCNHDGPTFEFLVDKLEQEGFKGDALYEMIIEVSYRADPEVNRKLGL